MKRVCKRCFQCILKVVLESRSSSCTLNSNNLRSTRILREDYNSDSEEEIESNYEVVGPDGDEDQCDRTVAPNVTNVANALANKVPFEEPSFMRVLDLEAMYVPEFPEYISADGEFSIRMEFSSREAVIKAMKEYTIRRSVDYRVYESEPLTFYAKCTQYGSGCDWLIKVSIISRKYCWVIQRIFEDGARIRSQMRYLKCMRCQVDWSMPSTSVGIDVTMASSRWTEFHVDMCLHVVKINDWTGKCMCMMWIRWTKFDGFTELGLGHWEIILHGLLTTGRDSYRIRT
ncbi:hypothetical protein Ahy_A06g028224 isoform A [Arachis hypogaea]|uniref:Transposase MuDR plant domain-containing protein n=1 Tax=Arachis hypogaea TaxID=3818 RepID=A0A445CQM8_ARAHY|nr:hypothetical protein Ahy_A06g028224 isoform A [Arachis hypogaea]